MYGSSVWTAGELAEAVDLPRGDIKELLESGEIRGQNVGQRWVLLKREALRWLRSYEPEEPVEASAEASVDESDGATEDEDGEAAE